MSREDWMERGRLKALAIKNEAAGKRAEAEEAVREAEPVGPVQSLTANLLGYYEGHTYETADSTDEQVESLRQVVIELAKEIDRIKARKS